MTSPQRPAPIKRLFIANRGEIALRVIRACRDLGIESVIGFSEADRGSLPVQLADHSVCIGKSPASQSYLHIPSVLAAALGTGCDAVHPGYGFLAENATFAAECSAAGLTFVGPSAENITLLGDKIAARRAAADIGVPVIPGSPAAVEDASSAVQLAASIGYPVLIKAGGGGGGRGLRRVDDAQQMAECFAVAAAEAGAATGNPELYIERFVQESRHVEIQLAADHYGNTVTFGERDCSVQRNYQKLVEEAPCMVLDDEMRRDMASAAAALASSVGYLGVGTVEFLVDISTRSLYFIEMNTRLQVEHPVTETVTGFDIVTLQLMVAGGAPIPFKQEDVAFRGHAIEFRINAEDPSAGFRPSAGRIAGWRAPSGPWVRTDTHCFAGYEMSPYYDSLLAKIIVHGSTREQAVDRARRALAECSVEGVATTLELHRWLLDQEDFLDGAIHTKWLEQNWPQEGVS